MKTNALDDLARHYGVGLQHTARDGEELFIADDTKRAILTALGIPCEDAPQVEASLAAAGSTNPPVMRAVPGSACALPAWLTSSPAWGVSLMLYELRSARNWGIGDFADLAAVSRTVAQAGAEFVGVNPLHAPFLADPARCSPFSPSNRLFLNPLYIAVDDVPGFAPDDADPADLDALRALDAVDYVAVARIKLAALHRIWQRWQQAWPSDEGYARTSFDAFCHQGGDPLRGHALFEALSASMVAGGYGAGWLSWPGSFQYIRSQAVASFEQEEHDSVSFHLWLQWLADTQLGHAAKAARDAGMRIGLYLDFAVGESPDGSATWSTPDLVLPDMTIGAPPDFFTAEGQEWGLAPPSPTTMRRTDFAQYRQTMQALTRHAGALRIDHAMALWQLFLVPKGGKPANGAYLHYPIEDMLRILTEVSQENGTVIIGEDLGYVPDGFQDVMRDSRILSYRILYFEKNETGFFAPKDYPTLALACLSTHDLPTLRGWWRGDDVDLRFEHGLIDAAAAQKQREMRADERARLIDGMAWFGVLDQANRKQADMAAKDPHSELPEAIMVATHGMVARTPSLLAGVRLADLTGEDKPTNLPGTIDSYPNWRLKNAVPIEDLADAPFFQSICAVMRAERPKS
ncbi:4-alpha-glucanotransferase [Tianweitania sp. BSSL-BM11]|uniref:4-alpha-glucanotransferase n=1 Tax=Tianweitania aestuarii TaxID=2814886 RepID=A0ABS5RQH0_9HYPH|nr:4-alpha-glucanotransferase [Tianweitania aestuarii]MBS9719283.1 4-alpha-glucanotransferase [Tianweitania aestuarii]